MAKKISGIAKSPEAAALPNPASLPAVNAPAKDLPGRMLGHLNQ